MSLRSEKRGSRQGLVRTQSALRTSLAPYALVGLGSASAQVIALVGIPLVSRVYSIDQIGRVSVAVAVVSILVSAAAWRLDIAIPMPEYEAEATSLTRLALAASLLSSSIFTVSLVTAVMVHPGIFSMTTPAEALFAGAMLWGTITFSIGSFSLLRRKAYRRLLILTVLNSTLQYLTQVTLGFSGYDHLGLQCGYAISGLATGTLALWDFVGREGISLRHTFTKYRSFPLHSAPASFLASLLTQVPILFSGIHFGARTAAFVALTQTGLGSPLAILSTSTTNTTLAEWGSGRAADNFGLLRHLRKISRVLLIIAMIIAMCAVGGAWRLAESILGPSWSDLWKITAILAPALIIQNAVSPFGVVPELLGEPISALRRDIVRTAAIVIALSTILLLRVSTYIGMGVLTTGSVASSIIYYWYSTAPVRQLAANS